MAECGRDQARGVSRELLDWKRAAPRRLLQDRRRGEGPLQREEWEQRLNLDAGGQHKQHASLNISAGWEGVAAAAMHVLLPSSSPSDSPGGCGLTVALGRSTWKELSASVMGAVAKSGAVKAQQSPAEGQGRGGVPSHPPGPKLSRQEPPLQAPTLPGSAEAASTAAEDIGRGPLARAVPTRSTSSPWCPWDLELILSAEDCAHPASLSLSPPSGWVSPASSRWHAQLVSGLADQTWGYAVQYHPHLI